LCVAREESLLSITATALGKKLKKKKDNLKLNLKEEVGGGAFQSTSERCHHWGFYSGFSCIYSDEVKSL